MISQPKYDVVSLPDGGDLRQVKELLQQGVQKPPGQFDFADEVTAGDSSRPGVGDHLDHPVGLGQRVLTVLEPCTEGGVGHDSISMSGGRILAPASPLRVVSSPSLKPHDSSPETLSWRGTVW